MDGTDDVVLEDGRGRRLHPAAQVGAYCDYLADFNAALEDSTSRLSGVAYLHNADDDGVAGLWHYQQSATRRMFAGQRRGEFLRFLKERLAPEGGADAADELLSAAVRPSKQLLDLAAKRSESASSLCCWTNSGWRTRWCFEPLRRRDAPIPKKSSW